MGTIAWRFPGHGRAIRILLIVRCTITRRALGSVFFSSVGSPWPERYFFGRREEAGAQKLVADKLVGKIGYRLGIDL